METVWSWGTDVGMSWRICYYEGTCPFPPMESGYHGIGPGVALAQLVGGAHQKQKWTSGGRGKGFWLDCQHMPDQESFPAPSGEI